MGEQWRFKTGGTSERRYERPTFEESSPLGSSRGTGERPQHDGKMLTLIAVIVVVGFLAMFGFQMLQSGNQQNQSQPKQRPRQQQEWEDDSVAHRSMVSLDAPLAS